MNPEERRSPFTPKLVFGLAVLAVGLILLFDSLHLYDAWHLLAWWPVVLVAFGLARLAQDGVLSLRGHIWLGLGVAAFIHQFGPWGLLDRWWPAFIVWGGLVVTLRAIFPQPRRPRRKPWKQARPSTDAPASGDAETGTTQVQP